MSLLTKIPGFRKGADPGFTQEHFVTALTDIQAGRNSTGKAKHLQQELRAYISKQLNAGNKIGPGAFSTGFTHIVRADSNEVVIPEDNTLKSHTEIVRELAGAALAHANNPDAAPTCNVFVLDDVLCGRLPSVGKDAAPFHLPVYGKDLHDNQVFLLQGLHPKMADLAAGLLKTHSSEPISLGNDAFAGVRAAWLASLLQLPEDATRKTLLENGVDEDVADRLAALAAHLKEPGHFEKFAERIGTAHASDGVPYPDLPEFAGLNLDKDIRVATTRVLDGVNDSVYGAPIVEDVDKIKKGDFVASHVFSVMNGLGARGVIQGTGDGDLNTMNKAISVSYPGVIDEVGQLNGDDPIAHASRMFASCQDYPILVRLDNNEYRIRLPLRAGEANAAEESAVPGSGPASAHGAGATAAAEPGLRVQGHTLAEDGGGNSPVKESEPSPGEADRDAAQDPAGDDAASPANQAMPSADSAGQARPAGPGASVAAPGMQDPASRRAARDVAGIAQALESIIRP